MDVRFDKEQPHLIIAEASCQTEVANLQVAIFVHLNARSTGALGTFASRKSWQGEAHPPECVGFGAPSRGILAPSSHWHLIPKVRTKMFAGFRSRCTTLAPGIFLQGNTRTRRGCAGCLFIDSSH